MTNTERDRLTAAFETMRLVLVRFLELQTLSQQSGSTHEGKVPKSGVQKLVILLDKFLALEGILREENGGRCPHCSSDHPPYAIVLEGLRKFAWECSSELISCRRCFDLGWIHVSPGSCRFNGESDKFHHIERCDSCCIINNDSEAVSIHHSDCGCSYFRQSCYHYNESSFDREEHEATQQQSSTTKLLEGSDTVMAELKKVENQADKFDDVGVRFTEVTEKPIIVLPRGMEYKTARFWLEKIEAEEEKQVSIDHKFPGYYPPDAALALYYAIKETYGFASQESTRTFFSIIPPATIGIQESIETVVQIPWGKMTFHGVVGHVNTQIAFVDGMPVMQLAGVIRKGDRDKIERLVLLTQKILRERSIYRGKAVIIDFSNFSPDDPRFDPMKAPKFMDLSKVRLDDLVLSANVGEMVNTNLFVPITHTAACRKAGIPLRRGILLAGPFGTGKTLTAQVTALLAVQNGWTFIYITDLKQLAQALAFAKNYGPAVVFGEDIDRIIEGERDEKMDEYLNAMDGVNRKHDEVLAVFSTNNPDAINPAMMRPGRIDAIIPIEAPDSVAAMALLRKYGRELIKDGEDLSNVGAMLEGQIPAVIREVVERSKLRAIRDAKPGEDPQVVATHLEQAATEMLLHVEYINPSVVEEENPLAVLGDAIGARIKEAVLDGLSDQVTRLALNNQGGEAAKILLKEAVEDLTAGNGHTSP